MAVWEVLGRSALLAAGLCVPLLFTCSLAMAQPQNVTVIVDGNELTPVEEIPQELAERGVVSLADVVTSSNLFVNPAAGPVNLPIDSERSVSLVEESRRTANGKTYVIGYDEQRPGSRFVVQLEDDSLKYGEIRFGNEVVNLTAPQLAGSQLTLKVLITDLLHPALVPVPKEPLERNLPSGDQAQGGPIENNQPTTGETEPEVVRIMVVYTEAARIAYDNYNLDPTKTIEDEIEFVVFLANLGYEQQGNVTLDLVHMQEVQYAETGDIAVDLERLACPCDIKKKGIGDNHLNEVFEPWKEHEADIVSMWVNYNFQPGIAYIMSTVTTDFAPLAVNAVHWHAAMFTYSFDHEVGHNFGARHDRDQDNYDGKPYNFNHGYMNLAASKVTMMAYPSSCQLYGFNCVRWPLWSDPGYAPAGSWGLASGDYAADNARTLRDSAPTISQLFEQGQNLIGCCKNYGGWFNKKWRPGPCD